MGKLLTLLDVQRARHFYDSGLWRSDTFYTLLSAAAAAKPNRFILRDTRSRVTAGELLAAVDRVAAELHHAGARPGDRVSIWLPSRIETVVILIACARMGYVCSTSLHRDNSCREVVDLLRRAGTVAFFAETGYGADSKKNNIFEMLGDLVGLKHVVEIDPLLAGTETITVAERLPGVVGAVPPGNVSADLITYLAFTSGTTGVPKGVMHSANTVLSNARAIVKDWGFGSELVTYTLSPMSHNMGVVALAITLVAGGELVLHTPQDAKRMFDRVVETGGTYVLGVPTHAIDLLVEADRRGSPTLGSVNAFQIGGAPVAPALVDKLSCRGVRVQNAYGMTENCSFQYTRPTDPPAVIANTCGRPCEGMETSIWEQANPDREVSKGEVGELGVRGSSLMLGYFGDQMATETSFNRHGWFMTGDLARMDETGNLQIVGRKKDVIIRGGHNIYPASIEVLSARHPSVVRAAAFPVRDERLGERVCLAIVARETETLTGEELLRHLHKAGLSKYEMPEFYIRLEALPLTPSGKVLKRQLVELVASGAIKPQAVRWQGD